MKTFKFFLALLFLSGSCIRMEPSSTTKHILRNESQQVVSMVVFKKGFSGVYVEKIVIPSQQEHKIEFYSLGGPLNPPPFGTETDSVRIIFNEKDSVLHTWKIPLVKNILKFESYVGGMVSKRKYFTTFEYIYAITEQDYQNIKNRK